MPGNLDFNSFYMFTLKFKLGQERHSNFSLTLYRVVMRTDKDEDEDGDPLGVRKFEAL
jgi:hypothetical protein